jgi:hypothetical protein
MREESLCEILCIRRRITAMAKERVERRPIGFTKIRERLLRRFRRLGLTRAQHKGPVRRLKRSTPLLQGSRDRFHNSSVLLKHLGFTIQNPAMGPPSDGQLNATRDLISIVLIRKVSSTIPPSPLYESCPRRVPRHRLRSCYCEPGPPSSARPVRSLQYRDPA